MKNKNSIFNPTPAQVKYRNRKWAEALMKSRKGTNQLVDGRKRCCLGVACDVAYKMFPDLIDNAISQDKRGFGVPDGKVNDFFGWVDKVPELKVNHIKSIGAVTLNDDGVYSDEKGVDIPVTHKQISECVLNTFVRPKNPIWERSKF